MKKIGSTQDVTQELLDAFAPVEGENTVYYGKVRNGKTRCATEDILQLLERGEIVWANWLVKFDGYDQRDSWGIALLKLISGNRIFYKFNPENFVYMNPDDLISGGDEEGVNVKFLSRLVGVHLFIDEGQWVLPSTERAWTPELVEKMKLVLHGGHYCRTLNIITQRPVNISKTTRSQIHTWYKCEKVLAWPFLIFRRSTITDMVDDLPDEENIDSVKIYWPWNNAKVFASYNTHGMRAKDAIEPIPAFEAYAATRGELIWKLVRGLLPRFRRVPEHSDSP